MTFTSLLRRLTSDSARPRTGRPPANRLRRRRLPAVEALEDRTVPSTLTVTSAADDGSAGTLRAVLAASHAGDTIRFAAPLSGHTITLTQGELEIAHNLSVVGLGASHLTISGNAAGRIFDVDAGVTAAVTDLTLTGGLATDGGAVLNAGTLSLARDVLTGNVAQGITGGGLLGNGDGRGGAVENRTGATLTVSDSTVSGNLANAAMDGNRGAFGEGGGLFNDGGTLTVVRSVLSGNQAAGGPGGATFTYYGYTFVESGGSGQGGAIGSQNGTLAVSGCTITNNTVRGGLAGTPPPGRVGLGGQGNGAGVNSLFDNTVTLTASTFSGNVALAGDTRGSAGGGAVSIQVGAAATVSGCSFLNNQAAGPAPNISTSAAGGALSIGSTPFQVTGCQFAGNTVTASVAEGGAMQVGAGGTVANSTFVGNVATTSTGEALGGAMEVALSTPFTADTLTLTNCIFTQNVAQVVGGTTPFAAEGGGLFISGQSTVTATNCSITQNVATAAQAAPQTSFGGAVSRGGGVDVNFQCAVTFSNCVVSGNQAIAGPGAAGAVGGEGRGGGLNVDGGSTLTVTNSVITGNVAVGGTGGAGAAGGHGAGGGISSFGSVLSVSGSVLAGNSATGGQGGSGAAGGNGEGGGIYSTNQVTLVGSATVTNSLVTANAAVGGAGGSGGSGGNGQGGGLFVNTGNTATLRSTTVVANIAAGGAAGSGGTAGQGVGGGAYNLGTLNVDALSLIFANLASTSDNDVFGQVTPI